MSFSFCWENQIRLKGAKIEGVDVLNELNVDRLSKSLKRNPGKRDEKIRLKMRS